MTIEPAVWVFGYGSLIWRADFPFAARRVGFILGYCRRFWQGSTDHRGVPEAPGRVVTLVPEPEARCWGVAYGVAPSELDRVIASLDRRERGGYTRREIPLYFADGERAPRALVYFATPDNPNFLGPAPLATIAAQVLGASGPSGPNPEYVLRLAESIAALGAEDPHVSSLAELVRCELAQRATRR
jgi:glutathione-specific gamma-glutamylcyclotransferase